MKYMAKAIGKVTVSLLARLLGHFLLLRSLILEFPSDSNQG